MIQSRVRQPDRVEHAAPELGHPGRGIAVAGGAGHGLRHQPAEPFEIHDAGELAPEAGRAGGQKERVLERAAEDGAGERGRGAHGSSLGRAAPASSGCRRLPGLAGRGGWPGRVGGRRRAACVATSKAWRESSSAWYSGSGFPCTYATYGLVAYWVASKSRALSAQT